MMPVRVLIAEPEAAIRALYSRGLPMFGFEVATATNGLDCLDLLRSFRPDVLVLEPELPWGNGEGVLARMREDVDLPAVPVILYYAGLPPGRFERMTAPPVEGYFMKPLTVVALADTIRRVVDTYRSKNQTALVSGDGLVRS